MGEKTPRRILGREKGRVDCTPPASQACLRVRSEGRFSLREGEGKDEGLCGRRVLKLLRFWPRGESTPHLNPLSFARGEAKN